MAEQLLRALLQQRNAALVVLDVPSWQHVQLGEYLSSLLDTLQVPAPLQLRLLQGRGTELCTGQQPAPTAMGDRQNGDGAKCEDQAARQYNGLVLGHIGGVLPAPHCLARAVCYSL